VRDDFANPGGSWQEALADGVVTLSTALFTDDLPPADLKGLVPKVSAPTFFIYGERAGSVEEDANRAFYSEARGPKQIWEVPGSAHNGGIDAQPQEYERRVVDFFDRHL
jgi:fermentation-respiration switch protein FrsA (DUF1100 family)